MKKAWLLLCTCLLLVMTGCGQKAKKETREEMANMRNPVVSVESAKDFESLGLVFDVPKGAEGISYSIIDNTTAQILFQMEGGEYVYRAAITTADIAGVYEERVGEPVTETVTADETQTQVTAQNTTSGGKTARWFWGDIQYSLFCKTAEVEDLVFLDLAKELAYTSYLR